MDKEKKINTINEEVLEFVWTKVESGKPLKKEVLLKEMDPKINLTIISTLVDKGFILDKGGEINLTQSGKEKTITLIRAHRLAERLFTDVLELEDQFLETNACTFEHILSPELCTSICTLLGHPKECPHGKPIPPGECCKNDIKRIESIIDSLDNLKTGDRGKILYIATKYHHRMDQLIALGISPGNRVLVHQTYPSYIIQVNQTDIALDTDVLKDIYVRKL